MWWKIERILMYNFKEVYVLRNLLMKKVYKEFIL